MGDPSNLARGGRCAEHGPPDHDRHLGLAEVAPIALALVYVGRREWRRAAIAAAVTAVQVVPALFYDLTNYPADAGESLSLLSIAGPFRSHSSPWRRYSSQSGSRRPRFA
jgi:hypothetical protein